MANWYVSPTGDDTTGDGTEDNPLQTWTHAHDQASSGDTIYFMAGDNMWNLASADGFLITKSLNFIGIPNSDGVLPRVIAAGGYQIQTVQTIRCTDGDVDLSFKRLIWIASCWRSASNIKGGFTVSCNSFNAEQVAFIGYSAYDRTYSTYVGWDFGTINAKEGGDFTNCIFMNWYYGPWCSRFDAGYTPTFNFVNCSWTRHARSALIADYNTTINLSFCNRYNIDYLWYSAINGGVVNESDSLNVNPKHIMTHSANNKCYRVSSEEWAATADVYAFEGTMGVRMGHYETKAGPDAYIYPKSNIAIDADTYKYLYFSGILAKTTGFDPSKPIFQWTKNGSDWFTAALTVEAMTRWDEAEEIRFTRPEFASLDLSENADWSGTVLLVRFGWWYDADPAMPFCYGRFDYILFAETANLPEGSTEKLRTVSELIDSGLSTLYDDYLGDNIFIGQGEQKSDVGVYGGVAIEEYIIQRAINGKDGIVLYGATFTITDATHSAGTVTITSADHTLAATERILIENVEGMTDLNGSYTVNAISGNTFDVLLTTEQSYTTGGTARRKVEVTGWVINVETVLIGVTDSGDSGWRTYLVKYENWYGIFRGLLWVAIKYPILHTEVALKLLADSDTTWSGQAIIDFETERVPVPESKATMLEYGFKGVGTLTPS